MEKGKKKADKKADKKDERTGRGTARRPMVGRREQEIDGAVQTADAPTRRTVVHGSTVVDLDHDLNPHTRSALLTGDSALPGTALASMPSVR